MTGDRRYDLVLLGGTGFTGGLTAEQLARRAPVDLRWALAGRNLDKLAALRDRLAAIRPELAELPLLPVDSTKGDTLAALAVHSRVIASTVGPYGEVGEELVSVCSAAGTDYLDLTGEPEFVDRMYRRYHEQAVRTGARLVHSCGFDSIPHDLGVYYTVRQLPDDVPITVTGVVRARARISRGTASSALDSFRRLIPAAREARHRRQAEPRPADRQARSGPTRPRRQDGLWLLPLPTIDPQVVVRSARALPMYGPDFRYQHYAGVRRLPVAVAGSAAALGLVALAQVPTIEAGLADLLSSGTGPSAERRAASWFRVRFTAQAGDRRLVTEVSGGDPGYGETAKMLAEAALCLATDELPPTSGQITTAVAMGDALLARLIEVGIEFRTLSG